VRRDVKYGHERSNTQQLATAAVGAEVESAVASEAYYDELLKSAVPIDMDVGADDAVAQESEMTATRVVDAPTLAVMARAEGVDVAAPADAAAKTRKKKPAAAPKAREMGGGRALNML
jgi:hypothetical protein